VGDLAPAQGNNEKAQKKGGNEPKCYNVYNKKFLLGKVKLGARGAKFFPAKIAG